MGNFVRPVPFIKLSKDWLDLDEIVVIKDKFGSEGLIFLIGVWMDMIEKNDWEIEFNDRTFYDYISARWGLRITSTEKIFLYCLKKGIIKHNTRGGVETIISPYLKIVMKDMLARREASKKQKAKERRSKNGKARGERKFNESTPRIT